MIRQKKYIQYAEDVLSEKIVTGNYIKLAAARFFRLMSDERYEFREDKVEQVCEFISIIHHYTGKHAGKPFILEAWQEWIVASMYGFYLKGTNERLVQSAYIEMARKQGKSAFASALCLYHLIADGEMNAEVYMAANSKDQAKVSFNMASNFSKMLDPGKEFLDPYRDTIKYERTLSFLKVLAADSSKLDGPNASMYLIDEYHAAKNSGVKDVLQSSQGMRENPMAVIITTAGFDRLGVCYQYREMCTEVVSGLKEDDTLFIAIYCLDKEDDWKDEAVWVKSNPNLGVTVQPKYIKTQVKKAINTPSDEVGIKTKNLNIWCDAEKIWIKDDYILAASANVNLEDYNGLDCFIGVDLSSTSDLTAFSVMIPTTEKMVWKTFYFLPEAALTEKRFKELYGEWARQGALCITPGNVVDYDFILNKIMEIGQILNIVTIGYDSWNATQFVINCTEKGLPMEPYSQSIGNFNKPTKELERLLLSGVAVIDNNIINRHCFRNVVMARDKNGNTKPSKQFEEKKIDGVIAMIEALGVYLMCPRYDNVIY